MSSLRQKLAIQKLSENIRNSGDNKSKSISMGKILREAGYSRQTSLKPKLVTGTKGFKEELNRLMPDLALIKKHVELLSAYKQKTSFFPKGLSDKEIKEIIEELTDHKVRNIVRNKNSGNAVCHYWSPDGMIRQSALDMMYKIKGYYHLDKRPTNDPPVKVRIVNYGENI